MSYGTAFGATVSTNYLLEISIEKIAKHNRKISMHLLDGLQDLGAIILGPKDSNNRSAIVAARFPNKDSADFASTLEKANVIASLRRDFIRFSPHLYNSIQDIDKGLEAIKAVI